MSKPAVIPQLSDYPEYREAAERTSALASQLAKTKREIEELNAHRPRRSDDTDIAALLAGGELTPAQSPHAWVEAMGAARDRLDLLERAVKEQRARQREIGAQVAQKIAAEVRPAYAALQRRMAELVRDLGALADEEAAFREQLQVRGIPASFINANSLDRMRLAVADNGSQAVAFLEAAEKHHGVKVTR